MLHANAQEGLSITSWLQRSKVRNRKIKRNRQRSPTSAQAWLDPNNINSSSRKVEKSERMKAKKDQLKKSMIRKYSLLLNLGHDPKGGNG